MKMRARLNVLSRTDIEHGVDVHTYDPVDSKAVAVVKAIRGCGHLALVYPNGDNKTFTIRAFKP